MKKIIITLITLNMLFFAISAQQENLAPTIHSNIKSLEKQNETLSKRLENLLKTLSPNERTALANRAKEQEAVADNPTSLLLYKPTYILPFYYTGSTDAQPFNDNGGTPDHQKLQNAEFKFQLSVQLPLIRHFLSDKNTIRAGYTQDSFWQVYTESPYFRETNYQPEIFFLRTENKNLAWKISIDHQSNGRGGKLERSWNRVYGEVSLSGPKWIANFTAWHLIFRKESADLHNPNITDYMGNGDIQISYKTGNHVLSFMTRNNLQSSFSRGAEELTYSYPMTPHLRGYAYAFSGYGQSLIEYDHYTNSFGLGIDVSDWI